MDTINTRHEENIHDLFMAKSEALEVDELNVDDSNESKIIGEGYYRLGKVHYDKADLVTAEDYFLKAVKRTIYPRDAFAMFKCYGFLIRIYSEMLREEEASKFIVKAEELAEKLQHDMGSLTSNFFYNVGMVFTYKGEFEKALENFRLSYQKAQKENHLSGCPVGHRPWRVLLPDP